MKRKGVTLIELIIVMAIMAILLTITTQALLSTGVVFNRTNDSANIQNQSLVLSRIVTDDLKYSTNVTIMNNAPTTFDESLNYIYEKDEVIYLKVPGLGPKVINNTPGVEQKLTLTKVNDKSIDVAVELSKGIATYENKSTVTLLNLTKDEVVNGVAGSCVSFETGKKLLEEISPEIISFKFLVEENSALDKDYKSENLGDDGIVIDNVNNTITVNSTLILTSETKSAELAPKIIFKGDKLKVKVGDTTRDYDVNSGEKINFLNNDVSFIIENYSGVVKEYKVNVTTQVFPIISNLEIVSQNSSSQGGAIIPSDNDILNAEFDMTFPPERYKVSWYAVEVNEGASISDIYTNYLNKNYIPFTVTENSNVLNVAGYSYLAGEYVLFFDVVPIIEGELQGEGVCSLSN